MLQKIQSIKLEPPILLATLLAVCLGGAAAWAATGVFSVGAFLVEAALSVAAQIGLRRLRSYLPWIFAPLLVIIVYWTQAERLDGVAIWPALIAAALWVQCLPMSARLGNYGYVVAYGLLLIGIAVGGIPVWCLLCLIPAPLAWRALKSVDTEVAEEWAVVTGMFLVAGYGIKGLIR
ncbi:MAG TPA: hypothetical protein PKZ84_01735 [Anaerolineae bacterium]|nr:hypothetical protein [Anaerolineae bacterium]HQI83697.1 hypothetical protein [Anaerolineae bacterium]